MQTFTRIHTSVGLSFKLGLTCVLLVFLSCLVPLVIEMDPYRISTQLRVAPQLWGGSSPLLGTDDLGRNVLARLVYGARNSVGIGAVVVTASVLLGVPSGLPPRLYRGLFDTA